MEQIKVELTEEETIAARMGAATLIRKIGQNRLSLAFSNLVLENVRMIKEINYLRSRLGLPEMEQHKVV